eukprot:9010900-Pyramimonas_sp.AAC.1
MSATFGQQNRKRENRRSCRNRCCSSRPAGDKVGGATKIRDMAPPSPNNPVDEGPMPVRSMHGPRSASLFLGPPGHGPIKSRRQRGPNAPRSARQTARAPPRTSESGSDRSSSAFSSSSSSSSSCPEAPQGSAGARLRGRRRGGASGKPRAPAGTLRAPGLRRGATLQQTSLW